MRPAQAIKLLLEQLLLTILWSAHADDSVVIFNDVRVSALSPRLVRIEAKGPQGFVDNSTFMVVNRAFHSDSVTLTAKNESSDSVTIVSTFFTVMLQTGTGPNGSSVSASVSSSQGKILWQTKDLAAVQQALNGVCAACTRGAGRRCTGCSHG